jgi:hypothetical protein
MILYINGDSHTAGAEAVNVHAFAEDDSKYFYMGRAPHPDNLAVSWGTRLAGSLKCKPHIDAESASSNTRIIRTTKEWVEKQDRNYDIFAIVQWSTWEREEWLIDNEYYQVNASGIDIVPDSAKQRYKEFIANVNWGQKTNEAHEEIWEFHNWLNQKNIKHLFFNGNSHFAKIRNKHDWGDSYIGPYKPDATFDAWLRSHGFNTVTPESYHYGPDAHSVWAKFLAKNLIKNKLI